MSHYPTMTASGAPNDDIEMLRRQAKDWLIHLATGAITKDELKALEDWRAKSPRHAEAFAQACQLWQALGTPLRTAEGAGRPHLIGRFFGTGRPLGRRA